ncbi:MAG TPA: phosphatase PAP2 family protein [Chthoniobacterales bacterium]
MKPLRHPREWLSATLLAGLFVMALAGALFVYLADEVGEQASLARFDSAAARFFHQYDAPWAVHLFEAITFFGNASTLAVLGAAVVLGLILRRRWSLLLGWVAALGGAGVLNVFLKGIFRRLRPQLPEPWVMEPGWSFPSGHAMGSLVTYLFLVYVLIRAAAFPPRTTAAALAVLVLMIGFSRIYLGAHYVSDVVGGYAAGAVWLTFCIVVTEETLRRSGLRALKDGPG